MRKTNKTPVNQHPATHYDYIDLTTNKAESIPIYRVEIQIGRPYFVHKEECTKDCHYGCNIDGFRMAMELTHNGGTKFMLKAQIPRKQNLGRKALRLLWRWLKSLLGFGNCA